MNERKIKEKRIRIENKAIPACSRETCRSGKLLFNCLIFQQSFKLHLIIVGVQTVFF